MANNIRQIKRRITASQNISKITKAMEMVAASKMKRAQDQALASRPYSQALLNSLHKVSTKSDRSLHPLLSKHYEGEAVLIIFSTNKGLCGGFNTNLFKATLAWKHRHPDGVIVAVGRKAVAFSRMMGYTVHAQFTDIPEKATFSDILPITSLVMQGYLEQKFRQVDVLYMDFVNTLSQKPKTIQLLPIQEEVGYADETMITPTITSEYIFEPDPKTILEHLLPYYIENTLYQTMLESKASEHSARMVAMKNASENAAELVHELRLLFNKSRQAAITSELLDITTASLTIK
jgi:F-type H+-transporting ATPase subunit gamma